MRIDLNILYRYKYVAGYTDDVREGRLGTWANNQRLAKKGGDCAALSDPSLTVPTT